MADFEYKCTDCCDPADEGAILWNDPELAIEWPETSGIRLSDKDAGAPTFAAYCRS